MTARARRALYCFAFVCLSLLVSRLVSAACGRAAMESVSRFAETLVEDGLILEQDALDAMKSSLSRFSDGTLLARYGYVEADFFHQGARIAVWFASFAIVACVAHWLLARRRERSTQRRVAELTEYLERVNANAPGTLIKGREDAFSCLQDEIYKTVTSLYQTREIALAAKRGYADNLANIAHQLKTPLTAAILSLQLVRAERPDGNARAVYKQLDRLSRLSEALLTLSRIDAGALALADEDVDAYTVLTLAADNLSDLLSAANVSVSIPEKGCVRFRGDIEWTMQVLMNLMKNALEHSPPGGTIHSDYEDNALYAALRVWDEGPGFDPSDLPRVFERFYRGKNAGSGGIGIGLSLAKSIVEMQNGAIAVRNLPEGGACFEIRFYRSA